MSDIYKILANKETWSIEEVLELLCGPSNPSAIIRGETNEPLGELLEIAANQGRFGMLTTGIDKFYWDMELLQGDPYPDEPLDIIADFEAHYLRFIDWIEDEDVLDKIQLDAKRKEKIVELIGTLNDKRPEVKSIAHIIDYHRLLEESFWTLTDLRIVLFGETHSSRYNPYHYRSYNSNLDALMQRVDIVIHDAALLGKRLQAHDIKNRPTLIDTIDEDKQDQHMWDLGYFGIYDTDENGYRSHRYYTAPDLFKVLANKQFPIPHGLIQSLEENQHKQSIELLRTLKENMLHLSDHGENPPQLVQEVKHQEDSQKKVQDNSENQKDFFIKSGDYWFISINGERVLHLRHSIGMIYIGALFRIYNPSNPHREIHVMNLEKLIKRPYYASEYEQLEWNPEIDDEHKHDKEFSAFELATGLVGMNKNLGFGTPETVITKDHLEAINSMVKTLNEELKEAIRIADKKKEEEISGEIDKYEAFLSANTYNGKIKAVTQPEIEKARQNVQKAIKAAINNIRKKNNVLGVLLDKCIHTGQFCSYRP